MGKSELDQVTGDRSSAEAQLGRPRAAMDASPASTLQRLAIEHGATQALAETANLAEAAPRIISTVCRALAWHCGSCWTYAPEQDTLRYVASWGIDDPRVAAFLEATCAQQQSRATGGLLRRTWLSGEAIWVEDVTAESSFRRAGAALDAGLHSAFAFPIKSRERVLAVMEFFGGSIQRPDAELLDCTRYIGSQIGQFCERADAQQRLRESEARFHSTMELAAIGIAHIDASGRFIEANQWLCHLLGYTREELLSRTVKDISHPEDRDVSDELRAQLHSGELKSFQVEKRYLRKDGREVWVAITVALQRDASGRPLYDISVVADVSERKRAEQALRESEARFRSLTELSSDWYWEQDAELRFTKVEGAGPGDATYNPAAALIGRRAWEIPGTMEGSLDWEAHRARLERHEPFRDVEHAYRDRSGQSFFVLVSGEPVFGADGRFAGYRGTTRDITARKRAEERIQYLATHDALTELPNRNMFTQLLRHAIDSAKRYNRSFAVMFIDLDRFKVINDTLGHEAGDELLRAVATRLRATLRASDVVARLGGDEFVVLVQEVANAEQVSAVARKVLSAVIKPLQLAGQECRVTASVGISMYPADAADERSLMKNADIAMYLAKEEGKNNFQFYSKDLKSTSLEKLALETGLRRALERREFSLEYQAKRDLKSGAIAGVEALLRWKSAELGAISPAQFIPLAEETGIILPLGKWVLRTACEQNMAWQREGLPPVRMAVNLSPRQFADPHLLEDVAAALRETGMPAELLELEITEGVVMHNPERAVQMLAAIKRMGVRLAIDDFGTGYSSLAQLKRFPIDTIKVDRSFIRDIPKDAEDKAITEAIIAMGKTLSLTVVAEGVETEEQQNFLRERSCDQMQGYYFSRPVPPEQFAALLRKHSG